MCEPATLLAIGTAISAATAVSSYQGQKKSAQAQTKAIQEGHNMANAQLEEQRRQQNVQARTDMSERAKQAMTERARLRAASAEGGLMGNSIDQIFGNQAFNTNQDLAMMTENARNVGRQSTMEGIGMASAAQGRMNQVQNPSFLNTGLQIAGIGVGAKQEYNKIKS
jgi:hypothetical protein